MIGLHTQGWDVRVLTTSRAVYAPLLTARQVAVEPWTRPRPWDLGGLRELRRVVALFEPDVVQLRGSAVCSQMLLAVARSNAATVAFVDLFEGDRAPGFLRRAVALRARTAAVVWDLRPPSRWASAAAEELTLIPPGHDPGWYPAGPALDRWGVPGHAFTVGAIACESGDEQLANLVDAARWLPMDLPIHFLLLAPHEEHARLRRFIRKNPFPQRFHVGDDIGAAPALMAQCDLFASLRWNSEPARRSVLHCLHHGVPTIAIDNSVVRQVLNPGVSGLVVPPHDPGAIAHRVSQFYERAEQREQLRAGALREAAARFSMDRVLQQTAQVIQTVLAGR